MNKLIVITLTLLFFSNSLIAGDIKNMKKLTKLQFEVTQNGITERPYDNEYWDNKRKGIYVDIISGEALFSSIDKFDSKTGWPSFTKPIDDNLINYNRDTTYGMQRIEVRAKNSNSHLGHVFNDGPKEHNGMRYCINSASLKFIPYEDLEKEGYGEYKKLFNK